MPPYSLIADIFVFLRLYKLFYHCLRYITSKFMSNLTAMGVEELLY